ncbi:MAG: PA domain-containing protein [Bacteroidota bacterium]
MKYFSIQTQYSWLLLCCLFAFQGVQAQFVNPRSSQITLSSDSDTIRVIAVDASFGSTRDLYCGGSSTGEIAASVSPASACSAVTEDLSNKIALVDRGDCDFDIKVLNAQRAGAIAVIICNNSTEALFVPRPVDVGAQVNIAAYFATQQDCGKLRDFGQGIITIQGLPPTADERDAVVWGADGEGSFTGDMGNWTATDYSECSSAPEDFRLWQWQAEGTAYTGAYAGNAAAINSPTACTGAMLFNSDFYDNAGVVGNFGEGLCARNQLGALISPAIDLSDVGTDKGLALKFYQGLRQFQSNYYVGWSIDGGMTWDSLQINQDLATNSTIVSRAERIVLPRSVNGQSDVRIKFTMDGSYYFWIIDDVQIIERESNNLAVDPFFAIPPNTITPASQITAFGFLADVRNTGAALQDEIVLDVDIFDEAGELVYENSLDYGAIPSDSVVENQAFAGLFMPEANEQVYRGVYSISSPNEDFNPLDNTQNFLFAISDSIFAKELGRNFTSVGPNFDDTPTWSYGNYFYVPNGEGFEVTSIAFAIGNPEDAAGVFVAGTLSKWTDTNEDGTAQAEERELVDFLEYEVTGTETANEPIILTFSEPPTLEDDTEYLLMMNYSGSVRATATDELAVQYVATRLLADSLGLGRAEYATMFGNSDDFTAVSLTPSSSFTAFVRMHINQIGVAVDEALAPENKVALHPNPVQQQLNITFDLAEKMHDVHLQVTDATGRLVAQRSFAQVHQNTFTFHTTSLANGVYYLKVNTAKGQRTKRFIVAQ